MFASYATYAFVYGDSAEEFTLPFMALSLFFLLEFTKGRKMSLLRYGLVGAFTSYTLWIKFTLCGFYFAWALLMLIFELKDKNYRHLLLGIAVFFGAFFAVCVPVLITSASTTLWAICGRRISTETFSYILRERRAKIRALQESFSGRYGCISAR